MPLFVQPDQPAGPGPYEWWQTGLGPDRFRCVADYQDIFYSCWTDF